GPGAHAGGGGVRAACAAEARSREVKYWPVGLLAITALALLAVPAGAPAIAPAPAAGAPFLWSRDSVWQAHEAAFVAARKAGCSDSANVLADVAALREVVEALHHVPVFATAPVLDSVEARLFAVTAGVAACPAPLDEYLALQQSHAQMIKW